MADPGIYYSQTLSTKERERERGRERERERERERLDLLERCSGLSLKPSLSRI